MQSTQAFANNYYVAINIQTQITLHIMCIGITGKNNPTTS